MSAIDRSDYSLSGIMPVVPRFDFFDDIQIEAPAEWEAMEAFINYEYKIKPIAHEWAIRLGQQIWQQNKPWYCNL